MSSDQGTPPPLQATASSSASPLKSPSSSRSAAASLPPPSPIPPPPPAFTPSPSPPPQSPTAKLDGAFPEPHASGSASPDSPSAYPAPARKPSVQSQPQLVEHLPLAHDAAMATFTEITHNDYHDKKLGRPPGKFDDYMLCDCNPATENTDLACTDESGCINRMTQIECSSSKCRWGKLCRNQRFHRRQYVNVDIVQTEKKGFGLRAAHDIQKESFVYEYVGEVMNQHTFLDRMQLYRTEGIRHFYFMMLQPNEYLDATKKGGKGRFINHSCNPNCSVSKWQVGKHLRMGIFAKRNIAKGEELTFNYNVDRYGNDAQECFCGEPNCVGTLGGKTQTDLSGMDDLFLDALGISDEVEQTEAKGSRRKRGKRLDLDFIPQMRPIQEHEATRVMTAARQAGPKREILEKLLRRMEMTTDVNVQKSLVKLHGFILMQFLLEQWWNDRDIVLLIINVLARWPLIARNKVIDCGIEDQVRTTAETYRPKTSTATKSEPFHHSTKPDPDVAPFASVEAKEEAAEAAPLRIGAPPAEDAEVSSRAEHLLEAWKKLDMTYRIARKDAIKQGADEPKHATNTTDWIDRRRLQDLFDDPLELDQAQAPNAVSSELGSALSGDQELRESRPAWQPPPPPPAQTSDPRASRRSNNPLNGSANSFPASSAPTGLTADQLTSALSSSLAKSLPGLVSSLQQHGFQMPQPQSQPQSQPKPQPKPQLKPEPQHAPPKISAPPVAKSIEEIIREANEHEERARKEAESAAKAARELELNGNLKPASSSSSSSRKRPSSSSRHADKRHKPSSSAAAARSSNGADAGSSSSKAGELAANNERRLRKLVGEVVVRQMSKHKDALERESFKRHAKELTNVIADKEMRNPKSWPPANGATLTELSSDKKAKMKSFATEYIDKLLARKAKAKVKDTPTTDEPGSSSHPANSSSI